jgi:hypothetical protein
MIIAIILYTTFYIAYIALNMRFLNISNIKIYNAFSGLFVAIISLVIWTLTYINNSPIAGMEEYREIWIPYNLYNFMIWPISYSVKNQYSIMILGVLNGIFAPIAIYLKRIKRKHRNHILN